MLRETDAVAAKYTPVDKVGRKSLQSMYTYLLANAGQLTMCRPRLRQLGVCHELPKVQPLVKTVRTLRLKLN